MVVGSGTQNKTVAVVGAGLVGALEACVMAQRGYKVNLYEFRKDIRTLEHVPGRSINLAMSVRGRSALRKVGVEGDIIERHAIPMKARMIHGTDGTMNPIPYNKDEVTADLIIGCDGAYSAVRKEMLKRPQFNYSQQYIPHGYMELCIPPNSNGEFAMPANYLHIWPRGNFMMIALPNQDRSWTVTLFMPFPIFDSLNSPAKLIEFFTVISKSGRFYALLIYGEKLIKDFFANKALPMITVKCSPYHVGGSCVILGDAAHAMVPFYGQGMNCGMEDCLVLDEILTQHSEDLNAALPAYSVKRNPDAEAIVDLAMYNYVEMRDLVNSRLFLIRKKIDNALNVVFPRSWVPLYTMVTFSREPYHSCILKKRWQDKVTFQALLFNFRIRSY
ncbi:hypothetical protein HAZT_HAZT003885 [Hyalella azteca]|uniref:Kynurenine 3-monooxygenase n=1 Tax=Hyalella azteca TaxID=294128 RepID=A0A6A0H9B1_HYAAZ|nr:hypothetical protein HAZT_HAZT003885 [Hyalella azteca]